MALIKCTECGKEFSDKAKACPNCGCPTEKMAEVPKVRQDNVKKEQDHTHVKKEQNYTKAKVEYGYDSEEKRGQKKKKNQKIVLIVVGVIAAIAVIGGVVFFATANSRKYASANTDYSNKKFEAALDKYSSLGDYKDSKEKADNCKYELTVEGQFMRALSEGLMARWGKSDADTAKGNIAEDPDRYAAYCDIELEHVKKLSEETFNDEKLGEDAKTYAELLDKAKESTKYYTIDYNTYATQWAEVYAQRAMLLKKFVEDYGLAVDETYQKALDDLLVDASAAAEQVEAREKIHAMTKDFKLIETEGEYGYKTYKLQMKNTTEFIFDYFNVGIAVLNSDGKIIDTGSSTQVTSWAAGQEAEVDAYIVNQTSLDGNTIQYTLHYKTGTLYE